MTRWGWGVGRGLRQGGAEAGLGEWGGAYDGAGQGSTSLELTWVWSQRGAGPPAERFSVPQAYTDELVELHRRLMALRERNVLQQVLDAATHPAAP